MDKPFYFSYSKLSCYMTCPLKYKFTYIDKKPQKVKTYFLYGTAIHNFLKEYFSIKPYLTNQEAVEIFRKCWITEIEKDNPFKDKDDELNNYNKGLSVVFNIVNSKELKESNQENLLLEQKIWTKYKNNTVINLIIDRIEYLGGNDFSIIDYKTGKEISSKLQLAFYQYFLENDKEYLEKIKHLFDIDKINIVKIGYYYTQINTLFMYNKESDNHIKLMTILVDNTIENIRNNNFQKNENNFCHFCDFYTECQGVK